MNNKGNLITTTAASYDKKDFCIQIMRDYHSGDEFLKKKAIEDMINLLNNYIYSVMRIHFPNYRTKYSEDLYQEGVLSIIKKMDDYDPELGAPTTFFHIYIKGGMNSFIIETVNHTTNHYGHNINKVRKAIDEFERSNEEYNNIDISNKVDIPLETVIACRKMINYSNEVSFDADNNVKNKISSLQTPEEKMLSRERGVILAEALNDLDEIKRLIVINKLGLIGERISYKTIAKNIGISVDKTRRLFQDALREMKNKINVKSYFGSDALSIENKLLEEAEITFTEENSLNELLESVEELKIDLSAF